MNETGISFWPTGRSKGGFVTGVEAVYPDGYEDLTPEQTDWEQGL